MLDGGVQAAKNKPTEADISHEVDGPSTGPPQLETSI